MYGDALAGSSVLDVTCSASYTELPFTTMNYIREKCVEKGIKTVILEGHYIYRGGKFFWFARHGRALTGASPEHAQIVGSV